MPPLPPFEIVITMFLINTTQIVISLIFEVFSRRNMSLPIFSTVQLNITICKYSTNVYWHWQSNIEASKGCKYYLSDLKSECNNGIKLLRFKVYLLIAEILTSTQVCQHINSSINIPQLKIKNSNQTWKWIDKDLRCISANFEWPTVAYLNILNMRTKILCHRIEEKINQ